LAETLDESAMQILIDIHLADAFPKQCEEWDRAKQGISQESATEKAMRQHAGFAELANQENALRRVLRDAVIEDLMAVFPCVLFENSSNRGMLRS
jgi:hypothetical protein